jgi:hypothetical protein
MPILIGDSWRNPDFGIVAIESLHRIRSGRTLHPAWSEPAPTTTGQLTGPRKAYGWPDRGRSFGELTRDFTPARRARVAAKAAALGEAMTLEELRKARSLSQEDVAAALTVNQPAVAKLEKRGDMHVSNLRRYIEALGGTLAITARFDKTTVVISKIGEAP